MMTSLIIPIFIIIIIIITIIMMKKLMKKMISGRETQLRSPFYSPLNSMWQVRRNHHDYHDGDHIKSFWWSYHPRDNHSITNLAEPVGTWKAFNCIFCHDMMILNDDDISDDHITIVIIDYKFSRACLALGRDTASKEKLRPMLLHQPYQVIISMINSMFINKKLMTMMIMTKNPTRWSSVW